MGFDLYRYQIWIQQQITGDQSGEKLIWLQGYLGFMAINQRLATV